MKTKFIFFIVFTFLIQICRAQEMQIKSVETLTTDISARTNPCFDINGDPCALIKVNLVAPNATFEGNVIKVIPKDGQYWVYMTAGSRSLTVNQPMILPCKIDFISNGVTKLAEKTTYSVTISLPEDLLMAILETNNKSKNNLNPGVFNEIPEDSISQQVEDLQDKEDYEKAVKLAEEGIKNGSIWCNHLLGIMYYNGWGVEQNFAKGNELELFAAKNGISGAQRNYGLNLFLGQGIEKNEKEGLDWLEIAAQNNNELAQLYLGEIYGDGGEEIDPDLTKSFKWMRNAAEQGNTLAQDNLGHKYLEGIGVNKNAKKAFEWFEKAAHGGQASGYSNMGYCYREGEGVQRDLFKAEEYFQKAMELGDAHGAYQLGYLYQWFPDLNKRDLAVTYYEKASDMGSLWATETLYNAYNEGSYFLNLDKDNNKANLYRMRLEQLSNGKKL